jgi:hypothetical protein
MKTEKVVSVFTKKYSIQVESFELVNPKEGEMGSGFLIFYTSKTKKFQGECLDTEHVERELKAQGIDKKLIKFILNYL